MVAGCATRKPATTATWFVSPELKAAQGLQGLKASDSWRSTDSGVSKPLLTPFFVAKPLRSVLTRRHQTGGIPQASAVHGSTEGNGLTAAKAQGLFRFFAIIKVNLARAKNLIILVSLSCNEHEVILPSLTFPTSL